MHRNNEHEKRRKTSALLLAGLLAVAMVTLVPTSMADPPSPPPPNCNDGIDNDGDGDVDYPDDKGCSSPNDRETQQCSDGIDNDNDGDTDYTNDPSCSSPDDDNEESEPLPCLDHGIPVWHAIECNVLRPVIGFDPDGALGPAVGDFNTCDVVQAQIHLPVGPDDPCIGASDILGPQDIMRKLEDLTGLSIWRACKVPAVSDFVDANAPFLDQ